MTENKPILLFDGICNLCNGAVHFILKNDPSIKILMTPLQSHIGLELLQKYNLNANELNSIVMIDNENVLLKSEAIFRVVQLLGGIWRILLFFNLFPTVFLNWIYDRIAKSRYRIFGKRKECMVPDDSIRKHFLA